MALFLNSGKNKTKKNHSETKIGKKSKQKRMMFFDMALLGHHIQPIDTEGIKNPKNL